MPKPMTTAQRAWFHSRAGQRPFGKNDRLGTLNHIDGAARARALAAMKSGRPVSLSRTLQTDYDGGGFTIEVNRTAFDDPSTIPLTGSADRLVVDCHTIANTHIDAFNHQGSSGTFYSGWEITDQSGPSVHDWSLTGIFTRGLHADISGLRGTNWVDPLKPVTGADIDAALARQGVTFMPGDALLLDMGRDRAEAAGYPMTVASDSASRPGLGMSGAEWVNEHRVSVLCWDYLDAVHPDEPWPSAHLLIWATGLVIVDNCDFAALRAHQEGQSGPFQGGLVMAPLAIPQGTGCIINPLLIT
jgi:kynurenine formamidase